MDYFNWAQNNLNVQTPHELQDRGVQVYFAPDVPYNTKVVNLDSGTIVYFHPGEDRSGIGYYADFDSLQRYAREHNMPFEETSGLVSVD